jgi:antitoxin ParD1/3/4
MRTNIVIDEDLMAQAMKAGPFKTKKDAVEAGLKLLARQAAYREILKWRGKLRWEGDESIDWTKPSASAAEPALEVREPDPKAYAKKRRARR